MFDFKDSKCKIVTDYFKFKNNPYSLKDRNKELEWIN